MARETPQDRERKREKEREREREKEKGTERSKLAFSLCGESQLY